MLKSNIHKGHRGRMKERFLNEGAEILKEHELLEMLLYFSIPRKNTNEIAHLLINNFGSLSEVFEADFNSISLIDGVGENTAYLISLISEITSRVNKAEIKEKRILKTTDEIKNYVSAYLKGRPNEVLYAFCLNQEKRVTAVLKVSEGDEELVIVQSKKIVEAAILHKSQYMIIAHNHPGGISYPSNDDIKSTRKISEILNGIDVELIDHIVVGSDNVMSLKSMNIF